jgi:hypothetical protein
MLSERVDDFRAQLTRQQMAREAQLRQVRKYEDEIEELERSLAVDAKSAEVLKTLLEDMANSSLKPIDKLVTQGLRRVFHDQVDLEFKSDLIERGNQLHVSFRTVQGPASGKATDSFGGSVSVVESLLLRIIVVLKMGMAPVFLLDETLAQVSDHYVEPLGNLIRVLCKKLGLTVLLVTHQQGFQETADIVYHADCKESGGVRTLALRKLKDRHGDSSSD